jgi:hypothetical protein
MPLWEGLLEVIGVLVALVVCYGVALVVRRRVLARNGGTFELSHRLRHVRGGRGWVLGLGRYSGDQLEWFRIFTLSPRPKRRWNRARLSYDERRDPERSEQHALYPGHVVIQCQSPDGEMELAMSAASLTGFQAWLEARPPGTDWSH